jgi:hypothetical protein
MRREGWHTLAGDSFMGWDYSSKIGIEYEEIEKNGKIYKKVVDFGVVGCQREGYCQHFLEND